MEMGKTKKEPDQSHRNGNVRLRWPISNGGTTKQQQQTHRHTHKNDHIPWSESVIKHRCLFADVAKRAATHIPSCSSYFDEAIGFFFCGADEFPALGVFLFSACCFAYRRWLICWFRKFSADETLGLWFHWCLGSCLMEKLGSLGR